MFELHQLEQLIAISEEGTISKAAERLHISQPALTRSIQRLEEDLNVTLFIRSKNKVNLSDTGELAVKLAYNLLQDANNLINQLYQFEKNKHTISIGSCAPGPLWEITPPISKYFPSMSVISEIKDMDILVTELKKDVYHIVITTFPIEDNSIFSKKICSEHLHISVPPAHPLSGYQEVSFEELNGESFLLLSRIGFWHELCKEKMPDSLFVIQDEHDALDELIKMSALPNFITDISIKYDRKLHNRTMIPISDKEAKVTFYYNFKKKNAHKFNKLMEE